MRATTGLTCGRSPIRRLFATITCTRLGAAFLVGLAAAWTTGCSSLAPRDFALDRPSFDPQEFFLGATHSWGVFENRAGEPARRFTTSCHGQWEGSNLMLDQTFHFADGAIQQRHWRIRRLDAHRYEATANDVAGVATGAAYGNAFHWEYTIELKPGNPFFNVRLEQWMYLQADGTVLNHGSIKKLGILLGQFTEHFAPGGTGLPGARTSPRFTRP